MAGQRVRRGRRSRLCSPKASDRAGGRTRPARTGHSVDDSTKQTLLSQFSAWLDAAQDDPAPRDEPAPTTDLYSLFVEMAGLRGEVRTESRLVKEALDQFRDVFETLRASQTTMQRELERSRTDARDQIRTAVRQLLLDLIDLRDRLLAALSVTRTPPTRWRDRWFRVTVSGDEAWRDGLRLTIQRLDQVLLERNVVALRLEGHPFDPQHARVIGTAVDSAAAEGIVVEEVRTGFLWDDQVLRTGDVIVNKAGPVTGDKYDR